ncbi:hypothetical protein [Streptomyces sp. NPDC014734]|uniref:hypothetical protein n=1 Tax=Streptomyces sp. NPDC014734 TaxID=3364886 RepID=UPI0036FC9883
MSHWDADGQRWVPDSAPGGGSGQPPPDTDLPRVLIVVAVVVLLLAVVGATVWTRGHDHGAGGPVAVSTALPEPPESSDSATEAPVLPDTADPDTADSYGADPSATERDPSDPSDPSGTEGPSDTVERYYDAINSGDFSAAWDLGGENLGASYSSYVSGFAGTLRDTVTVRAVEGDTVYVDITAHQTDGTRHTFAGTYTVLDGVITGADIERTG